MENTIDRRVKINFMTLNEEQENKIVGSLIDFLTWYKRHEESVNRSIKESGEKVNDVSLVDFWIKNIGKSEEIEGYLNNINVVADCYEYIKKYKKTILMLRDSPEKWVCAKNYYRTSEQASEMKELLMETKNHPKTRKIITYLKKYCLDEDHISSDYAERIINKCKKLKKKCNN